VTQAVEHLLCKCQTLKKTKRVGCGGACMQSQLLGRQKQEDCEFKVSPGLHGNALAMF
jgi:hypothetical protein